MTLHRLPAPLRDRRRRLTEAIIRFDEWQYHHEPRGAPADQWVAWRKWVTEYRNYLSTERSKLYDHKHGRGSNAPRGS